MNKIRELFYILFTLNVMPCISIIIPAYNAQNTLQETVKSVQDQTFSDIEIIIINDGSTDQTLDIVHGFVDPRIKLFSYTNGGLPIARNRGISQAKGNYISFIDADDLWAPDKLERQLAALNANPDAAVAYSWTQTIDERGNLLHKYHPTFLEGDVYPELLVNNFISNGSNILARREAILTTGEFDKTLKSCEDWDYFIRLASKYCFVVVPDWQIFYRQSFTAMTSRIDVMETAALVVIEKAYQSAPSNYQWLKKKSLAWIYEYVVQQQLRCGSEPGSLKVATQKFWQAVKFRPQILLEGYGQSLARWLIKRWLLVLSKQVSLKSSS